MTTKYVLVITLFILILIPSSLARGIPRISGASSLQGLEKRLSDYANKIFSNLPDVSARNDENQGGSITYYNVTYSYIDIAFNGPYSDSVWDLTGAFSFYDPEWDLRVDFIWANCDRQSQLIYESSYSPSFSSIPCTDSLCPLQLDSSCNKECSHTFSIDDQDSTNVTLTRDDKFTLGSLELPGPDIIFLCGTENEGVYKEISGIIELGWGALSLVSQLGYGRFSYCLNSDFSGISPLFLLDSQPIPKRNLVRSTPLIQSTQSNQPSAYYVNLKEISVGTELLPIPNTTFSLREDGSGGVLLDWNLYGSFLEPKGYQQVKNALLSNLSFPQVHDYYSNMGYDVCFSISESQFSSMPTITLHFDGGADMVLDMYSYLVSDGNGNYCLAILSSTSMESYYDDETLSVLGYLLQSDMLMFFDLKNSMLSYMSAECNTSMTQQYPVTSSSNLILSTGVGIYFQILFAFMFQVLVGFVF